MSFLVTGSCKGFFAARKHFRQGLQQYLLPVPCPAAGSCSACTHCSLWRATEAAELSPGPGPGFGPGSTKHPKPQSLRIWRFLPHTPSMPVFVKINPVLL